MKLLVSNSGARKLPSSHHVITESAITTAEYLIYPDFSPLCSPACVRRKPLPTFVMTLCPIVRALDSTFNMLFGSRCGPTPYIENGHS